MKHKLLWAVLPLLTCSCFGGGSEKDTADKTEPLTTEKETTAATSIPVSTTQTKKTRTMKQVKDFESFTYRGRISTGSFTDFSEYVELSETNGEEQIVMYCRLKDSDYDFSLEYDDAGVYEYYFYVYGGEE